MSILGCNYAQIKEEFKLVQNCMLKHTPMCMHPAHMHTYTHTQSLHNNSEKNLAASIALLRDESHSFGIATTFILVISNKKQQLLLFDSQRSKLPTVI